MNKILAIHILDSNNKKIDVDLIKDLQINLFKNGYSWINDGNKVDTYIFNDYIVIINDNMYTMSLNNINYLSKEEDVEVKIIDSMSYFRYLKLKKLDLI